MILCLGQRLAWNEPLQDYTVANLVTQFVRPEYKQYFKIPKNLKRPFVSQGNTLMRMEYEVLRFIEKNQKKPKAWWGNSSLKRIQD